MKFAKMNRWNFGKSIYMKVMISFLISLLFAVLAIEISNLYVINKNRVRAEELFQNSLDFYSRFWGEKFRTLNASLLTIVGFENGENFNNICDSTNQLTIEISKIGLLNELDEIANRHENKVYLLAYVPKKNIYVYSKTVLWSYEKQLVIDEYVRNYINNNNITNNTKWDIIKVGEEDCFIQLYHMGNGYIGAIINARDILEELQGNSEIADAAAIEDKHGKLLANLGMDLHRKSVLRFDRSLKYTDSRLVVLISDSKLYSNKFYIGILTASTLVLAFIIILLNMLFQKKTVFNPLERLREAMEKFSEGNTRVLLPDYQKQNEIRILYQTFNKMAEQILKLKIDVYETMLEKQRIQGSFLRVQIQPHFYTNILNLIYGFAEIKDYKNIQALSVYTSRYFRYLLSDKEDFVTLEQEMECVRNYIMIQQKRYLECLEVRIDCRVDTREHMIPPLLVQTFLENSIKHNITLIPKLEVSISIWEENRKLKMKIEDNGVGFDKTVMHRLNAKENIEENGKHIGISNIRSRLALLYQEESEILIRNMEQGTEIMLSVPVKKEKSEAQES